MALQIMEDHDSISACASSPKTVPLSSTSTNCSKTSPKTLNATPSASTSPIESSTRQSDISLEEAIDQLSVADRKPELMFNALEAIFQRATEQDEEIGAGVPSVHVVFERARESARRGYRDVEALRAIKTMLEHMWWRQSEFLVIAARNLADGSRESGWRIPYGEAGILDFFLAVISTDNITHDLSLHALRLIGNSCADTDVNRERVVTQNGIPSLIKQLRDPLLVDFTIPVIYNISDDYEPAQEAAKINHLCPAVINLLTSDSLDSDRLLGYVCRLLDYAAEHPDTKPCPDHAVQTLLRAAFKENLDVEDFVSLADAARAHLRHDRFQRLFISQGLLGITLGLFLRSYSPQDPSNTSLSVSNLTILVRDPEEEEQLSAMRSNLIEALSDVSAIPQFAVRYPLNSAIMSSLLPWLSASQVQLQICSCVMLGNLARSDAVCRPMVRELDVHESLIEILQESSDVQLLHSTLGFLRNLALPSENKAVLGDADIIEAVSSLWSMDTVPQLQYGAASLTRQIINGSLINVQRLLVSLSPDTESPAHEKTYLSLFLSLFETSDSMPTKVEIARTIASIWRCINSSSQSITPQMLSETLRRLCLMHPNIGKPISLMVSQSQWPIVRSEGWFAMALMARSREGSAAVNDILHQIEVFGPLVETIKGRSRSIGGESSPAAIEDDEGMETESRSAQERDMRVKDRDNALVMISELLKNRGNEMSALRRGVFENLLGGRESPRSMLELMTRGPSPENEDEDEEEDEE